MPTTMVVRQEQDDVEEVEIPPFATFPSSSSDGSRSGGSASDDDDDDSRHGLFGYISFCSGSEGECECESNGGGEDGGGGGGKMKTKAAATAAGADATTTTATRNNRSLRLLLVANSLFVAGSAMYLRLACSDLRWSSNVLLLLQQQQGTSGSLVQEANAVVNGGGAGTDPSFPYYELYSWDQLPETQRRAAAYLGYDQLSWDAGKKPSAVTARGAAASGNATAAGAASPSVEDLEWSELTLGQRQAASALGYDQRSWDGYYYLPPPSEGREGGEGEAGGDASDDGEGGRTSPSPPAAPAAAAGPAYELDWSELTPDQQKAAGTLGYTQETWDGGLDPAGTGDTWWDDLPEDHREAASELGYTRRTWDDDPDATYWDELTPEQQDAALSLGYDERTWRDRERPAAVADTAWEDLTAEQRDALTALGFDEGTWNAGASGSGGGGGSSTAAAADSEPGSEPANDDGDETATRRAAEADAGTTAEAVAEGDDGDDDDQAGASTPAYERSWSDLTPEEKHAAYILGYVTVAMWDDEDGDAPQPETSDLDWAELSDEQREAATVLGYDETLWDGNGSGGTLVEVPSKFPVHYGDHSVMYVPSSDTRVSRYMVLFFFAALCFVLVGAVDLVRQPSNPFHCLMIMAGLMGLVSAMLVERNPRNSAIFNSLSVHFYLLEAIAMAWNHSRLIRPRADEHSNGREVATTWEGGSTAQEDDDLLQYFHGMHSVLTFAVVCFGIGSLIDVVLSYVFLLDVYSNFSIPVNVSDVVGQSLWVACSAIYLCCTIVVAWRVHHSGTDGSSDTSDDDIKRNETESSIEEDILESGNGDADQPEIEVVLPMSSYYGKASR